MSSLLASVSQVAVVWVLVATASRPLPVAKEWFVTEQLDSPSAEYLLYRTRETHETSLNDGYAANYYLLRGASADVLIDAGFGFKNLSDHLQQKGVLDVSKPLYAIATHEHYDHAPGLRHFVGRRETQIMVGAADALAVQTGDIAKTASNEVRNYSAAPWLFWNAAPVMSDKFQHILETFDVKVSVDAQLSSGSKLDIGGGVVLSILELPGHTPGSIGIYDASTKTIFTGDAVYSGELLDDCIDSNKTAYRNTMKGLRSLHVQQAYPGHNDVLSGTRYLAVIDCYLGGETQCRKAGVSEADRMMV